MRGRTSRRNTLIHPTDTNQSTAGCISSALSEDPPHRVAPHDTTTSTTMFRLHVSHRLPLLLFTSATTMDADAAGQDAGVSKLGTQAEKDRRLKKK